MGDFLEALKSRRTFGMRPGLETMNSLLDALGHPEKDMAAIHIAGTNGKGSVAALCEAALRTAGYPVGRFTSPHLLRINERFFVNGEPVEDAALEKALAAVEAAAQKLEAEHAVPVTFFEVLTAAAYLIFRDAGIQLIVLETGLGGQFDATNTISLPLVSVITRIGLDHCAVLGDSLEAIAGEKAGIIKEGRPVVIGAMPEEAQAVIARRAFEFHAPFYRADELVSVKSSKRSIYGQVFTVATEERSYPSALSKLCGAYQMENVATAVCALERVMEQGIPIPEKAVVEAIRTVYWPARMQLIAADPPVFLDGGHNPDAFRALADALKSIQIRKNLALVAGFCDDKDAESALKPLSGITGAAWAVAVPSERGMPPEETAAAMRRAGLRNVLPAADVEAAIDAASAWADDCGGAVLICGSLFLAGEVLRLRGEYLWGSVHDAHPNEKL